MNVAAVEIQVVESLEAAAAVELKVLDPWIQSCFGLKLAAKFGSFAVDNELREGQLAACCWSTKTHKMVHHNPS